MLRHACSLVKMFDSDVGLMLYPSVILLSSNNFWRIIIIVVELKFGTFVNVSLCHTRSADVCLLKTRFTLILTIHPVSQWLRIHHLVVSEYSYYPGPYNSVV